MGVIVSSLFVIATFCFAVWYFTRPLPAWLRLIATTFLFGLLFAPVLVGGEGGAGIAPLIILIPFNIGEPSFDSLERQLTTAPVVVPILVTWVAAYIISMIVVGIHRKMKTKENPDAGLKKINKGSA